jgi:phage host-nuclease inhibitor protein Gam
MTLNELADAMAKDTVENLQAMARDMADMGYEADEIEATVQDVVTEWKRRLADSLAAFTQELSQVEPGQQELGI